MSNSARCAIPHRVILFLLLIGFLFPSTVPVAHAQIGATRGTLIIAVATDSPPFAAEAENGQSVGFDLDLIETLVRTAGLQVTYESVPFIQLIPGVATRLYDAALGCIYINEDRKSLVDFTAPYFTTGGVLAFSDNSKPLYDLTDLTPETKISILAESADTAFLAAQSSATLLPVASQREALELAVARVSDAAFADEITVSRFQRAYPEAKLQVVGGVLKTDQCAIAVSKENPRLLLELNAALTRLKNNGKYLAIYRRWFGSRPLTGPRPLPRPISIADDTQVTTVTPPAASPLSTDPLVEGVIGPYLLVLTTLPVSYQFIELAVDGRWLESQIASDAAAFRGIKSLTNGQLPARVGNWQVLRTDPIALTVQLSATVQISPTLQNDSSDTNLLPLEPRLAYQLTIQDDGTVRGLYTLYQTAMPTVTLSLTETTALTETLLLTETVELTGKRVVE